MISMTEYAARRRALMEKMGPDDIAIIPSAQEVIRNGDAAYHFRQQSDFYYLTGFAEPDAVAVLLPNRPEGEYILFNRIKDKEKETWDGPRVGQVGACELFLANQSFPIEELENKLPTLMANRAAIHYPIGIAHTFDTLLLNALNQVRAKSRAGLQSPNMFVDITPSVHEMRLFKSPAEIAIMQKAIDITAHGHIRAMEHCKPGMNEYQIEAEVLYAFLSQGARHCAYSPIVGGGKNTCILHYITNNQPIKDGDLLLIDAGAEYEHYAADITRTFPINGRFSGEQRAIYELVLASQLAALEVAKPGKPWPDMQTAILKVLIQGLIDLGLMQGSVDGLIESRAYLPFYMHNSGHWLGLDVHDAGRYRIGENWRTLAPGMVLTVEPGLYISADIPGVDKRWHNIGVRIEDNVLITEKGHRVLSEAIPKTIQTIEETMVN